MSRWMYPVLLSLLVASCAGLDRLGLNCDRVTGRAFRPLFEIRGNPELLETRLLQAGHVAPNDVQRRQEDTYRYLDWQRDGLTYTAGWNETGLVFINIRFVEGQLSAGQALACFGKPEGYQAWYNVYPAPVGNSLHLAMVFLKQGSIAYASQYLAGRPAQPPPVDGRLPIHMLSLFGPGWAEEQQKLGRTRPWPEAWRDLKVDVINSP